MPDTSPASTTPKDPNPLDAIRLASRLLKHRDDLLGKTGTNASELRVDLTHAAQILTNLDKLARYCGKCALYVPPEKKLEHLTEHALERLDRLGELIEGKLLESLAKGSIAHGRETR